MTSKTHEFPFANYFLFIGVAFLALATPCFLFVRERGNPHPRPIFTFDAIAESTAPDDPDAQVGTPISRACCASSSAARSIRTRSTP